MDRKTIEGLGEIGNDMYDILIRNTALLTPNMAVDSGRDIAISSGIIAEIGVDLTGNAKETIDGKNKLFMPGLVDGHTHLTQQFLRGKVLDSLPPIWTRVMLPFESTLTPDAAKTGAELACLEMIKSGTTAFVEAGGLYMNEIAPVIVNSGLRGALTTSTITTGDVPDTMKCSVDEALRRNTELYEEFHGAGEGRVSVFYSLRSYLFDAEDLIERTFQEAQNHKTGVHIHLNEYAPEITACIGLHKMRPLEYLDSFGVLDSNLVAAHCILLSENEIDLIRDKQIKVIHCPFSNCGKGAPPTPRLLQQGCHVGLGTDGAAHGGLSLWNEMKIFRSIMNLQYGAVTMDPAIMPAPKLLKMASQGSAAALGMSQNLGRLETGAPADVISIDLKQPHIMPSANIVNTLVECVNAGDVRDSIINGKLVMRDRQILTMDEERIMAKAHEIHEKLV